MSEEIYAKGGGITFFLAFLAIWEYAFHSWGLLLGLAFGWFPAVIGGFIIAILWPLVWLLIIGVAMWLSQSGSNINDITTLIH